MQRRSKLSGMQSITSKNIVRSADRAGACRKRAAQSTTIPCIEVRDAASAKALAPRFLCARRLCSLLRLTRIFLLSQPEGVEQDGRAIQAPALFFSDFTFPSCSPALRIAAFSESEARWPRLWAHASFRALSPVFSRRGVVFCCAFELPLLPLLVMRACLRIRGLFSARGRFPDSGS